ncbi:hypothetical protein [Clostridium sp. E02]|uniref:hypothetical protein n=1 Tax=Clostridium sp. E02 TaxID=2487134 RepID=UPI000F541CE7|nr:hypothetical protein [Clostridium sp. E02]
MNYIKLNKEIQYCVKKNKRAHFFEKIPFLRNIRKKNIKNYTNAKFVKSIIYEMLKEIFKKIIYFILFVIIPIIFFQVNDKDVYIIHNIFFLNILFGSFHKSYIFDMKFEKYFSVNFLKINMKPYILINMFYKYLIHFISLGISLIIIFNFYDINRFLILIIILLNIATSFFAECLYLICFEHYNIFLNEMKIYDIIIIAIGAIGYLPLLTHIKCIPIELIAEPIIIVLCLCIISACAYYMIYVNKSFNSYRFINNFNENKLISKIISNEMNEEKKSGFVDELDEDTEIKAIDGYKKTDYLNEIFFQRYKSYFFNVVLIRAIIAFIVSIVDCIYWIQHLNNALQIEIYLPLIIIEVSLLCSTDQMYRHIYEKCDKSMTQFYSYLKPDILKSNALYRLKRTLKDNLLIGILFILPITFCFLVFQEINIIKLLSLILTIFISMAYYSIYYTMAYYLVQPYGKKLNISLKSYIVSFCTTPVYLFAFLLNGKESLFIIILCVLTIIFLKISMYLIPKLGGKALRKLL